MGRIDGSRELPPFQGEVPELGDEPDFNPEDTIDRLGDLARRLHLKLLVTAGAAGLALGVFLQTYQ